MRKVVIPLISSDFYFWLLQRLFVKMYIVERRDLSLSLSLFLIKWFSTGHPLRDLYNMRHDVCKKKYQYPSSPAIFFNIFNPRKHFLLLGAQPLSPCTHSYDTYGFLRLAKYVHTLYS